MFLLWILVVLFPVVRLVYENNQNSGLDTPLDKIDSSNSNKSANPMDTNWGGKTYTENRIKAGDYKGREVYKHNI